MKEQRRFEEIICMIGELVEEAIELLPKGESHIYDRAKSYWYAHIKTALDDDHEFLSKSECNMYDTLEEWRELNGGVIHPQFSRQEEWDDYVARNGINQYEEAEEEESEEEKSE